MAYFETAGQSVVLQDMSLTLTKQSLITAIIANITLEAEKHNLLNTEAGAKINDLRSLIATAGSDLTEVNDKISEINNFLTENAEGLTVIGSLNQLFTELNRREESKTFEKVVNTSNGILDVSLDSFGFNSVDDYNLQVSVYGYYANIRAMVTKVSKNLAQVHLVDHKEWEFNEETTTRYDASVQNVKVSLTITRMPVTLSKVLTEPDGDQTTIGEGAGTVDLSAPDAPTASVVVEGDSKLTVSGTAEAGATVKVVFPDNSEQTIIATNGTYTLTSASAIAVNGNIVVNATDASGNVSVATVIAYTVAGGGGNEI
jgi:hypothetical protein